jgi:hypothetical protein
MVALSEGHSIAPGSWAVSLQALPSLKIMLPATPGRADFVVTLVALDGAVLDEKKATLVVQPPPAADRQPGASTPPAVRMFGATSPPRPAPAERPARPPDAPPTMLPQDRERAHKLTTEGDALVAQGNIAAARQLYEMAAEAGLAQAAMALAGTYDAAELARLEVRGIQPDAKEATHWYERARQLGAVDADQRLQRLGAKR